MTNKFAQTIFLILVGAVVGLWPCNSYAARYEYDALNRLTRVVYDESTSIEYTYDEVGNRTRRVSSLMADTSIDGDVDFEDFAIMASRWLEEGCGYPDNWCEGADIDWSTEVDTLDLAVLAQQWLKSIGQ